MKVEMVELLARIMAAETEDLQEALGFSYHQAANLRLRAIETLLPIYHAEGLAKGVCK